MPDFPKQQHHLGGMPPTIGDSCRPRCEVADMKGWHMVQSTLLQAVTDSRTVQGVIDAADALFHARLMFKSVAESKDRLPHL